MSVSLKIGESFKLCDANGNALKSLTVGLGWDAAVKKKGGILGFFSAEPDRIDCDASVFLCKDGKVAGLDDVVFFENLKHKSGAIEHKGDNKTGKGDGDDEQIEIHPLDIPREYDKLIFIVNIFNPIQKKQNFGMIKNAFIRFVDNDSKEEICRFDLSGDYCDKTAMIFGELQYSDDMWKFVALGEGTKDDGLEDAVKRYK